MENSRREMGIGWPLGLGSIHWRVRLVESFPVAAAASTVSGGAAEQQSIFVNVPSSTFSSFSSSNLDTESTVSFFQDNSKTLGRLMGFRGRNNRRSEVYMGNSIDEIQQLQHRRSFGESQNQHSCSDHEHGMDIGMCTGFCVPLCLLSKSNSTKVNLKELN